MIWCKWAIEMDCVFCWQHYDRSSSAADSNILDEVKKVMNILYHTLQPQFVPSMSYDGLQIRHSFMTTIRVCAQNLFMFLVLVFKWVTKAANCLMCIVPVSQSSHNICTKDLMQNSKFLQHCLLRSILEYDTVLFCKWLVVVRDFLWWRYCGHKYCALLDEKIWAKWPKFRSEWPVMIWKACSHRYNISGLVQENQWIVQRTNV